MSSLPRLPHQRLICLSGRWRPFEWSLGSRGGTWVQRPWRPCLGPGGKSVARSWRRWRGARTGRRAHWGSAAPRTAFEATALTNLWWSDGKTEQGLSGVRNIVSYPMPSVSLPRSILVCRVAPAASPKFCAQRSLGKKARCRPCCAPGGPRAEGATATRLS